MRLDLYPKQLQALTSRANEILYGGAAGGGKSHLMRVAAIAWCLSAPGVRVFVVRREYPDLKANHFDGRSGFPALLGPWLAAGMVRYNVSELTITFSNGSQIVGRHCQREKDVDGFQGVEIDGLLMDELTHFTEYQYQFIRSRCRTAGLSAGRFTFPRILCGSNPGGPGHTWVKAAWVDPQPPLAVWKAEGPWVRQFIPARLSDNPSLGGDAGAYAASLDTLPPHLRKALREGDWNVVAGGMFDDVWHPARQVLPAAPVPQGWPVSRCFDWGSSKPFACLWVAEADGQAAWAGRHLPKGSLVVVAEWYGWNGQPNQGARMTAADIGRGIVQREREMGMTVTPGPGDSAMFATENGQCIADDMARQGAKFLPSDKGPGSRINGWQRVRQMLQESARPIPEGPGLWVAEGCRHLLRTLPVLPRDTLRHEDVDTDAEDHAADALRYRCSWKRQVAGVVRVPGM